MIRKPQILRNLALRFFPIRRELAAVASKHDVFNNHTDRPEKLFKAVCCEEVEMPRDIEPMPGGAKTLCSFAFVIRDFSNDRSSIFQNTDGIPDGFERIQAVFEDMHEDDHVEQAAQHLARKILCGSLMDLMPGEAGDSTSLGVWFDANYAMSERLECR